MQDKLDSKDQLVEQLQENIQDLKQNNSNIQEK